MSTDDRLVLLNLNEGSPASKEARKQLLDLARDQPQRLAGVAAGARLDHGALRLGPDGVFYNGRNVADLDHVVQSVARLDVVEVLKPRRRSAARAIIGAAAGAGLGFILALRLAYKDCGESCADEWALIWTSVVGLPVGLGVFGYHAPLPVEVIYRAGGG